RSGPALHRSRERVAAEDGLSKTPLGVAMVRVDNRLVHGQVLEAWLPALDATAILVADDEAAGNVLARSAMTLAIPPGVKFEVVRLQAAAEMLRPGGRGPQGARTVARRTCSFSWSSPRSSEDSPPSSERGRSR